MTRAHERDDLGAGSTSSAVDDLRDLRLTSPADSRTADVDSEADPDDPIELPGADLSRLPFLNEEIEPVVPIQSNEFTCHRCFLVHHVSNLAYAKRGQHVCQDCV